MEAAGFQSRSAMGQLPKNSKGFVVRRRCDDCGAQTSIALDDGEKCTLKCMQCGKEYSFYYSCGRFPAYCEPGLGSL